jgi:hypothetical protein
MATNVLPAARVDTQLLRKLYSTDETAKAMFDHLARRERNWKEVVVDRIMLNIGNEGFQASRSDVVRVLKALEKAGCGKFVVGRAGHPSRFRWDVEMVAVGRHAAGQPAVIEQVDPATPSEEEVIQTETVPEGPSSNGVRELAHAFRLRPDLPISFKLPVDLTATEAARLADFIKTLPFDETAVGA